MTIVEAAVSVVVVAVGMLGFSSALVTTSQLDAMTEARLELHNAGRDFVENLRSADLDARATALTANSKEQVSDAVSVDVSLSQDLLTDAVTNQEAMGDMYWRDTTGDGQVDAQGTSLSTGSDLLPLAMELSIDTAFGEVNATFETWLTSRPWLEE